MLSFRNHQPRSIRRPRKLPREGALIAALDTGTAKTSCFIARVISVGEGMIDCDIVGAGHYGARLSGAYPATGEDLQAGSVAHRPSLAMREKAIRGAVEAAETLADERIQDVHCIIPGHALQCRQVGVDLDIAGGFVTGDDIVDSLKEGAGLLTPEGAECLHALPTGYSIDGEEVGTDPRGLRGSTLTTRMLGIHAGENTIANFETAIENAGLRVASWLAAPLMSARGVLVEDEKELGVLMIDIGAYSVSYAVYHDGRPIGCGGIVPGGNHITRDLAQAFSTPIAHAERQKVLHGSVLPCVGDDHRFVEMLPMAASEINSRISRADMTAVILPRMEEIYETLIQKIVHDNCALGALRRVVITGGGSQLDGVREHAERVFAMKARIGKPIIVDGAPEALTGPGYSACAGAIQELADGYGNHIDFPEMENLRDNHNNRTVAGVGSWIRARF